MEIYVLRNLKNVFPEVWVHITLSRPDLTLWEYIVYIVVVTFSVIYENRKGMNQEYEITSLNVIPEAK